MDQGFKILYVSDTSDKSLNLFKEMASYAKTLNIVVKLVILGKTQDFGLEQIDVEYIDIPFEHSLAFNSNPKYFKFLKKSLENVISQFNPNLIHSSVFSAICVEKGNIPAILTLQDEFIPKIYRLINNTAGFKIDIYQKLVEYALNEASKITVSSKFLANILIKIYKLKKSLKVIYNGVNEIKEFKSPEKPYILTKIAEHDTDKFNLLKKLSFKIPSNVKIRAIGKDNFNCFSKNIEFISESSSEQMSKLFEESSIYLSFAESKGMQEIEAAMNGCAIVANDSPLTRELWSDCGCIFEYNNSNSLIRSINNLIENPPRLVQHIKSCKSKAISDFNLKFIVSEYWNLYNDCYPKSLKASIAKAKEK